jgi:sucrose 6(F)-phosphate phosphorylase
MSFANKAQLISYPDSMGGSLRSLREAVLRYFPGCFAGGVHVLPPYPSSGDRGFAPIDYSEIDGRFGTWEDIAALGDIGPVMLDLMVNHVSRRSAYFKDFLEKGRASPYARYFIDVSRFWPGGEPDPADLAAIFLRRKAPYSDYELATGETARVWTTFGHEDPSEQIDLDFGSPEVMRMTIDTIAALRSRGVRALRLDAVGYIVKRRGTSCFFVEPEIWDALGCFREAADGLGVDLLPEIHSPLVIQRKLADRGYWGYDFALPFLVLQALLNASGSALLAYLRDRPPRLFTMLDCHDGIPVKPDLDGLVDEDAARRVVDLCLDRGANLSKIHSRSFASPGGFDVHQIRCALFSALGGDEDAHVAARAIQLFVPGIPQVYYVGLLAGGNDEEAARSSGDVRAVNRHNYTMREIESAAGRSVVRRLQRLLRLRNECPAFDGRFSARPKGSSGLELSWENGPSRASLAVDLGNRGAVVTRVGEGGAEDSWKA